MADDDLPPWVPYRVGDIVAVSDGHGNMIEARVTDIRPGDDGRIAVDVTPLLDPPLEPWYFTADDETPPPDPKV